MNPERIEKGDTVNVHFLRSASIFNGVILKEPYDIGDCWEIKVPGTYTDKNIDTGKIIYFQFYEQMELVKKGV